MVRERERLEKCNIKKINFKNNYRKIEKKKKKTLKLERLQSLFFLFCFVLFFFFVFCFLFFCFFVFVKLKRLWVGLDSGTK